MTKGAAVQFAKARTALEPAHKAIAQRLDNGVRSFREQLVEIAGITAPQANKVIAIYLKEKIAKQDFVDGIIRVKHGAFLGRDVLLRAVEMTA